MNLKNQMHTLKWTRKNGTHIVIKDRQSTIVLNSKLDYQMDNQKLVKFEWAKLMFEPNE